MAIDVTQFINDPHILIVEKDMHLHFTDCNSAWLKAAHFKDKDQVLGLNDKNCAWSEYTKIYEQHENDILSGQAYAMIQPTKVEDNRFCWIHNYKWPKYDNKGEIIGLNVLAYEIVDRRKLGALYILTKKNKFGLKEYKIDKPIDEKLTKREKEVLFYLCYGMSTKKIAAIMNISCRTAEIHISHIKLKFHCENKSQIIEYAVAKGYVAILPGYLLM